MMCCPKCERLENVLAFRPLRQVEKFEHETNAIVKCPNCGWLFSPGVDVDILRRGFDALLEEYGYGERGDGNLATDSSAPHLRMLEGM